MAMFDYFPIRITDIFLKIAHVSKFGRCLPILDFPMVNIKIAARNVCVDKIRISAAWKVCVDTMGSGRYNPSNNLAVDFFLLVGNFAGQADCLALPHTGTLTRLITTYPNCQRLGKREQMRFGSALSPEAKAN